LGSVGSLVSEKKIFEISANQSILLALAAILNIRLERKTVTASSLKPLRQLKPNCPGMIIGRSSTNFLFYMPIGNPRWPPPQDRLTLDPMGKYSNAFYSETTNMIKIGSNVKLSPTVAAILNFISEQKT
jgi:hypothetical protein